MRTRGILLAVVLCMLCSCAAAEASWRTESYCGASFEVPAAFTSLQKNAVGFLAGDDTAALHVYAIGMEYEAYGNLMKITYADAYITETTVNGCNMLYAETEDEESAVFIAAFESDDFVTLAFSYSEPIAQREAAKERAKELFVRVRIE